MFGLVPGLQVISSYRRQWLLKDVIAGVVLTTLLVPQGMAYAELAGLPPITGLYTSILCLLGYAVFGPSRILVLGPDSSLGPMIAATILPLMAADGDAKRAVALASILAIMVAAIMILAAVAKLGFIADLISKPTMIGYMNGLALTILIGQLPKLFGFKVKADNLIGEVTGFAKGLAHGEAVAAAAAVGIAGIALILVLQRWLPKVPAVLIMVVLAIASTSVFHLADHGVSLVGVLPKGFPPLTIPHCPPGRSRAPVRRGPGHRPGLPRRHDLHRLGVRGPHRAGGPRQRRDDRHRRGEPGRRPLPGFPGQHQRVTDRGGRTVRCEDPAHRGHRGRPDHPHDRAGPGPVPEPAPARPGRGGDHRIAVPGRHPRHGAAVAAAQGRVRAVDRGFPRRRPARRAARDRDRGRLSILNVFRRAWWPYDTVLGRVEGLEGYHDIHSHPDARHLPGLVIYRFDAPLFFANATTFRDEVRRLAQADPPPIWILIAAEPVTDVDTTASDVLEDLDEALNAQGISLVFAELKDPVRRKIERYGLTRTIDPHHFFPTIEAAIAAFRDETGAQWTAAGQPADGQAPQAR